MHVEFRYENRDINWYLDRAADALGGLSDVQLGGMLGLSRGVISTYRTARAWPEDATMAKLADLALVPVHEAVVDLQRWKSRRPDIWENVLGMVREYIAAHTAKDITPPKITKIAGPLLLALVAYFGSGDGGAQAKIVTTPTHQEASANYTLCDN